MDATEIRLGAGRFANREAKTAFAYLAADWWPFYLLIPLTVSVEAYVLWMWARPFGFLGNLWRAVVLYVVARDNAV
jgi:hypothetical protein